MKYIKGIILFLTLFIFCSCSELRVVNPEYGIYYSYGVTVDYPYNRRYIPRHEIPRHRIYVIPRYRTYVKSHEYRFNKY